MKFGNFIQSLKTTLIPIRVKINIMSSGHSSSPATPAPTVKKSAKTGLLGEAQIKRVLAGVFILFGILVAWIIYYKVSNRSSSSNSSEQVKKTEEVSKATTLPEKKPTSMDLTSIKVGEKKEITGIEPGSIVTFIVPVGPQTNMDYYVNEGSLLFWDAQEQTWKTPGEPIPNTKEVTIKNAGFTDGTITITRKP